MVRLLHARTSRGVDRALQAARAPFLLFVYSNTCGHCVRMMPAFKTTLEMLGQAQHDVVQLAIDALRQPSRHSLLRGLISASTVGVPFIAVMKPGGGKGFSVVPLPDSSNRSAVSLSSFANKHISKRKQVP